MKEMTRKKIRDILISRDFGNEYIIKGWVRTMRAGKKVAFITVNDGSTIDNIQVVADVDRFDSELLMNITTGASIMVKGILAESVGQGQNFEIQASGIEIYGMADTETYPLQKKSHSMEFLRAIAHLRPRTNTFGAIFRLRHHLSFAIHKYFNDRGFYYIHTPIITGSDAEGAGEMFRVTILDLQNPPRDEQNKINFKEDFFGRETNLTVSGQLEAEVGALALSAVYTFGPTFRAENSNTPRHLAEFWMIEPEMAFYDIHDNMDLAEDFLKYLISYSLEHGLKDLQFLQKMYDKDLINRLNFILENDFIRITYTEGLEILQKADQKFEFPVKWGSDLQAEHERYLVEKHYKKPVIITDYPKESKAFYMKQNDDRKTVRAMDVLFPKIGEIIGGSQREEDYNKLLARIREMQMPEQDLWWYLETRKFGTVPHSGFGLGFERLVLFISGMSNIRDVIPFPRTPNNAEF
jgi:asparaginyl-tRNA synthetase